MQCNWLCAPFMLRRARARAMAQHGHTPHLLASLACGLHGKQIQATKVKNQASIRKREAPKTLPKEETSQGTVAAYHICPSDTCFDLWSAETQNRTLARYTSMGRKPGGKEKVTKHFRSAKKLLKEHSKADYKNKLPQVVDPPPLRVCPTLLALRSQCLRSTGTSWQSSFASSTPCCPSSEGRP